MRPWIVRAVWLLGLAAVGQAAQPMKWESLMLVKAAAEKGDPEAQFLIGLQYKVGDGLARDRAEAAKWLRKAAESGHAEAQYALGDLYADSTPEDGLADPAEAVKWLQAAAAQGNVAAKSRLDALLAKPRSPAEESSTSLKPAGANQGTSTAGPTPGLLTDKSREMDEDPAETVRWSLLLSGLRGAEAFLVRGLLLENGIVVNRDLAAAADSYRKAAGLGDARAQFRLGMMYAEGRGVAKDIAEAGTWLGQAATNGSAEAVAALARLKATPVQEQTASAAGPTQKSSGAAKKP